VPHPTIPRTFLVTLVTQNENFQPESFRVSRWNFSSVLTFYYLHVKNNFLSHNHQQDQKENLMPIYFIEKLKNSKQLSEVKVGTLFRFKDDSFHSVLDDNPPLYIVLQQADQENKVFIMAADMKGVPILRNGTRLIVTYDYEWQSDKSFMKKTSYLKDVTAGTALAVTPTDGLNPAKDDEAEKIDENKTYLILPMKAPTGQIALWDRNKISFHDDDIFVVQRPYRFVITIDSK
jgi:hypothetical protein